MEMKSFLNGKYPEINAEINTRYEILSVGDWFFQGEDAANMIDEIYTIWVNDNCMAEEAIIRFKDTFLY